MAPRTHSGKKKKGQARLAKRKPRKPVVEEPSRKKGERRKPKTPKLVPKDFDDSDSSFDNGDSQREQRRTKLNAQIARVPYRLRQDCKEKNIPAPKKILKITQEQYDKAKAFLGGPPIRRSRKAHCVEATFSTAVSMGGGDMEYMMSDHFMLQEMVNCVERGNLDGLLGIVIGAYPSRRPGTDLNKESLLAACYALFYHPAAKDEEIFQRCLEANFNTEGSKFIGKMTVDQILRLIMSAYDFESDV